jgi:tetratricopeptide (TPR) repeat protein
MTFLRRHTLGLIALAVLVLVVADVLLIHYQNMRTQAWSLITPPGLEDIASQMAELGEREQFDDEIQLGMRSLTGRPSDYFIYQMVAQAYAIREYRDPNKDPKQATRWAELAAQYAEKALSAEPNDLSNIFNVGQTYELAGDNLSTSDSCRYFQRAVELLENLSPKLRGDRATIQGESFRLAPFRQHNAEEVSRVKRQLASCADRVPTNEPSTNPVIAKAATEMTRYAQKGDYEKAVEIGLAAAGEVPDPWIYQQIAMVYLMRAHKQSATRDDWLRDAVFYANKSCETKSHSAGDLLNLYEAGRILEDAGDLSSAGRCEYYRDAVKKLTDQAPLLEGDSIAAFGYRHQLAPMRNENQKALTRVKGKFVDAGCK